MEIEAQKEAKKKKLLQGKPLIAAVPPTTGQDKVRSVVRKAHKLRRKTRADLDSSGQLKQIRSAVKQRDHLYKANAEIESVDQRYKTKKKDTKVDPEPVADQNKFNKRKKGTKAFKSKGRYRRRK